MIELQTRSNDRAAQSLVEYALLIVLIVLALIAMTVVLGNRTSGTVGSAADSLGSVGSQDAEPEQYVHVDDIEIELHEEGQSTRVRAVVTVLDQDDSPVAEVDVSATWWVNDLEAATESDATDGQGRARLSYRSSELSSGDVVELVVDYLEADDYTYDSSSDVVTSAELTVS